MDGLPWHLMNEILFRIDLKSLAMMRCTYRSLRSHITHDPHFESEYFSRVRSGLLHTSTYGSSFVCYHSLGDSRSPRTKATSTTHRIMGSCSGLVLLCFDLYGLCVANPLTKKFRFLSHSWPKFVGFAVDQIDRTTQSFKIVCMTGLQIYYNTMLYEFSINAGDSWRLSKTKIACHSSDLDDTHMKNPVYFDGSLHWLRNDGSILAFNPETEHAQLIPVKFPEELCVKTLFAAGDKSLNLISATTKVIYVYALESILNDPKWVLERRIKNGVMDENRLIFWNLEAYDGKCLVLREETKKKFYDRKIHVYDLRANKWGVMGSIPSWCDAKRDFVQYTPSMSSVIGLHEKEEKVILGCDDELVSSISSIMSLIIDGISSEKRECSRQISTT